MNKDEKDQLNSAVTSLFTLLFLAVVGIIKFGPVIVAWIVKTNQKPAVQNFWKNFASKFKSNPVTPVTPPPLPKSHI